MFAIEKSPDAFKTFEENFLADSARYPFQWPEWLGKSSASIGDVLVNHFSNIKELRGRIELVAGGPPCQGFSMAGRRRERDPRNLLFLRYVEFVKAVKPKVLLVENVPGMQILHGKMIRTGKSRPGPTPKSYYQKLIEELDEAGYFALGQVLDAADFGVPQIRPRLIVIGARKDLIGHADLLAYFFSEVESSRIAQLKEFGLKENMTAKEALSDLEIGNRPVVPYDDPSYVKGFSAPAYVRPRTSFQRLMHQGMNGSAMDSIRLARHSDVVRARFKRILAECRQGVTLSVEDRKSLGLSKHRTFPMAPDQPAPTVTTLPDDVLHYREPRILSVRESARLQSFPDWFKFRGKYTTGGLSRTRECPRYTQVGNAVPPLLARALGAGIANALAVIDQETSGVPDVVGGRR